MTWFITVALPLLLSVTVEKEKAGLLDEGARNLKIGKGLNVGSCDKMWPSRQHDIYSRITEWERTLRSVISVLPLGALGCLVPMHPQQVTVSALTPLAKNSLLVNYLYSSV